MSHQRRSLDELEQRTDFVRRHIGPSEADQSTMLEQLGLVSMEGLIEQVVPATLRSTAPLELDPARTEQEVLEALRAVSSRNQVYKSLIGMGYYNCFTPPVILRNILENPAWYTSYTPYQPEISQGRLEAMLNFQTMICELSGMEIANASLLDEATAAAEAMTFCQRSSKSRGHVFFVSRDCHPQTIQVVQTRAKPLGIDIVVGDHRDDLSGLEIFGVLLQYPASTGALPDYAEVVSRAHEKKALVVVAADLLSLVLLQPPSEFGADVVVGNSQRFGVPLGYGGPHAAFFATRDAYKRTMPGRLVGVSVDSRGDKAYRLALQTREQHIRREKATSNICTAQALLAVIAGMYAVYHGPQGLTTLAQRVHRLTTVLAEGLRRLGYALGSTAFFDTLSVATGTNTASIHRAARQNRINLRAVDDETVGISLDETVTRQDVETLWVLFGDTGKLSFADIEARVEEAIPASLRRAGPCLQHPIFDSYHSETEMLRYMRSLADKDLALDRAMIPLGSCTMKLNATTEMIPITWEGFNSLHPFAPLDQAEGYRLLLADLQHWLAACTGYDAVSVQPNSGAQGEYAGLLAIRAYHESRGQGHRDICLIPSSAHGTNPASAQMAGLKVVVTHCNEEGDVDVADLRAKAEQYSDRLAALMVTYPSTHGVFEEAIQEICEVVHGHGGQVYIDGANLNALIGVTGGPGKLGGDVSHLNLHKTFCIPHGGGGPGVGPIAVKRHLAPFLPGLGVMATEPVVAGPVSAAPWGSAGILPISWAYIALMGRDGLRQASCAAILNANYIAHRLAPHYPVLYTGPNGRVAHECIIDLRPIKETTGISVDDVAKRLIDYGFHAPTMSFPVPGTLMIEPTESESKHELDRFCDAMIRIREEIHALETGALDSKDNPLVNAPHTTADLVDPDWSHPYSREQAVFPSAATKSHKYWPPVGRIDNVYGDRNLICSCPPLSDYEKIA
ncbi:MAG: aminomethyl-transferring glycine dehydrogenase [Gammaproteobacteria bacterium]|nr:aminomethyl-transferring glycine dehydrogenase [Gammaproteobacteria bacterium]MCP5459981.1 aminomethyl-transferring glycine dehydrogenase [Gammaproteobacteria bacterium]